jgi:hypothetical protein
LDSELKDSFVNKYGWVRVALDLEFKVGNRNENRYEVGIDTLREGKGRGASLNLCINWDPGMYDKGAVTSCVMCCTLGWPRSMKFNLEVQPNIYLSSVCIRLKFIDIWMNSSRL